MPTVTFEKDGLSHEGEVRANSNLVVRAGIKQFPYPHLRYSCGMGKCASCACRVVSGAEHLPPPNWKEKKMLGTRLEEGFRLVCQLWIDHDITLNQDADLRTDAAGAPSAAQA
ncbi:MULTISPECIES: 2Fe-2S iron-sulfur cluster-binding protein [Cupriavidus]